MSEAQALAKIDYLTLLLWVFVILSFIKICLTLYDYYKKRWRIKTGKELDKETTENRLVTLERHDNWQYQEILKISKGIDEIKDNLIKKEINDKAKTVATLRTQLYDLHEKFINRGYIDQSGLKTFLELGSIYERAGGDDIYHDKLKPEILSLPIKEKG